jgi:hypothetical protein
MRALLLKRVENHSNVTWIRLRVWCTANGDLLPVGRKAPWLYRGIIRALWAQKRYYPFPGDKQTASIEDN